MSEEHIERGTNYNIEINDPLGTVIGDNARVEQHFNVTPATPQVTRDELLGAIREANAELRGHPDEIAGMHIDRLEVDQIVEWILQADPKERLAMVLDQPGRGKTVVMHDVLVRLEDENVPVLAIKADFLSGIRTRDDLAGRLGLPAAVEACARHLATEGLCVILLDQLDALSLSLSRDQTTLDVMLSTLARLRNLNNVRIVASCRTFDLNNDPRLSQVKVDRRFQLQPLTDEQIDRVLQTIGVDPSRLLPAHRELLTTPLHLDVYARVALAGNTDQPPESFYTLQELYEALWRKRIEVVPPDSPPPVERIAAIYQLVEVMQNDRQITASIAVLDDFPEAAAYLERVGFIRREDHNWLFFHQTLFDYCYARRFVAQGKSLSQEILSGPQGLFERSQMVQVLAYLRGASESKYQRELTSLLFSEELRFHLRLLLIGWFGSLPGPTAADYWIARRLIRNDEDRVRFLQAIGGNSGWFDVLSEKNMSQWLRSTDEQLVNQVTGYLGTMVSRRTETVLSHLQPFVGTSEVWDRRIAQCLGHLERWQSENAIRILCDLLARNRTFGQEGLHLQRLAESNPAAGCRVLRVYLDQRLDELLEHEATGEELERAPQQGRMVKASDRTTWDRYLLGEYAASKVVERALQECPGRIIEDLLPWFRRAAETLSELRRDDDYPHDPIFASYWYGDHLSEGPIFAWQMAEALRQMAQENTKAFRGLANDLAQVESLAVQRVLIHAYLADPEAYADEIFAYFVADSRRLNIGEPLESPHYDSRRLFADVFPHLSAGRRAALEQMILNLKPEWELRVRGSFGITQLRFLKGMSLDLLSEAGRRKRRELEHKFPDFKLHPPQGITGGMVGPPIEQSAQEKMSDGAWLNAMRKYDDTTGWGESNRDLLKGGVIQLSRSFEEQVKKDPERFYKLAQRFDDAISLHYVSAAISGLAESDAPAEWVFELARRFSGHIEGEFRRYLCRALTNRADDSVPDDLLEMIGGWALQDPDPEDELWQIPAGSGQPYYGGDPHHHGINTNRGAAIRAVCHCALKRTPPQFERAFALLEQTAGDPSTAVRACIVEVLGPFLNQDADRTLSIFERTMEGHPALLPSPLVHRFLYWVYREHFDRIRPFIEALLTHTDDNTRQAGARLACLTAFHHPSANKLAEQALAGDVALRRGAAQVYARNLEHDEVREVCRERLLQLMHDSDEDVQRHVGQCFMHLQPEDLDGLRRFIKAFLNSPALLHGAGYLIEYLNPLAAEEHEVALLVADHILQASGDEIADIRHSLAIIERDLVKLPLTVYTHSSDKEQQEGAMQLFEQLLSIGSRSAQQALSEWDGKIYPTLSLGSRNLTLSEEEERSISIEKIIRRSEGHLENAMQDLDQRKQIESHIALANAYGDRLEGNRAENIEKAIEHYRAALEILDPDKFSNQWSDAQTNLATTYRKRIRGNRADNIETAIRLYREVLGRVDKTTDVTSWTLVQSGLATAYRERIRGDRANNVEQAISHYQAALEVLSLESHFEDRIRVQTDLATAYRERLKGSRSDNLEFSLDLYQKVLSELNREKHPAIWATVQTQLATTYRERIQGSRAQNLEMAIVRYGQALDVYSQKEYPGKWAKTLVRLAEAYRERIRGERDENLEQAIQCYFKALQANSHASSPFEWADINFGLASVYLERLRGDRGENVEQAIILLQQASEVYTRVASPQQWATIQNNLGAAYLDRIRGERADNLEMAIHHFQRASEVYTQEASPEQWASTMTNLATVYQDRFHAGKSTDNEEAVRYYQRALEVYSREVYPEQWAAIQINLGNMHLERTVGERVENLQQAIYHFRRALDIFNREVAGERRATIVRQLERAQRELTLTEFFGLWSQVDTLEKGRTIHEFSKLFSRLVNCPLQEYQHLPEIGGHLAIFDMSSVFEDTRLPFSEEFPVLYFTPGSLDEDYQESLRRNLETWVGPTNRRAVLIPFCEAERLASIKDFTRGTIKQVHAYDLVCLSQDELELVTRSEEPATPFHRIILSEIDLASVNPYKQTGATSGRMFFGRERELQAICDQATSTNFVLTGGRRIGKTSILKQLEKVRLPSAGFDAYYHSCDETPTQVEMVQALTMNRSWFPEPPKQAPSTLVEVVRSLPDDKPIVVLFDEVDKLIRLERAGHYSTFGILRALSNSDQCRFVLCGERLLREELTNPDSPLYNFGISMPIGRLDFHAVMELVTSPMKQLEVRIIGEEDVVQRIWDFTSGHPSIVQSLCRKVIEQVNERKTRTVTLDEVETVIKDRDFLEKDFLNVYWERATVLERLCCLIMSDTDEPYTLVAVRDSLADYDIRVTFQQVYTALERLIELRNILERIGANYKFAVSAFPEVITRTARLDDFIALYKEKYQRDGDLVP